MVEAPCTGPGRLLIPRPVLPGAGQLVHGVGLAICSACVALAVDILDDRLPTR
jgi:hypothetical protein